MRRANTTLKQISLLLLCTIIALANWASLSNAQSAQKPKATSASAALPNIPYITIDTNTGLVLNENRSFDRWHPASLTKLMTAYVTFKAIQNNEIQIGSPVTMSKLAAKMPPSKMGYKAGSKLRVDTAITILVVKSANDVAVALAESVAGSLPNFANRMNDHAKTLGMQDSNFKNPHGLHDKNQYVSARDMLILSNAIWTEFPQYRKLFGTPAISTTKKTYYSYNLLLERFAGAMGMKTGFVCASGYNIVASAERDGRRLVSVVFGANSQTQRAVTAAKLLSAGFQQTSGTPLENFSRPSNVKPPKNMRPILCTQEALKNTYNPNANNAVIKSAFLEPRKITQKPIPVRLGGVNAPPSDAWLARAFQPSFVPVPQERPNYVLVDIDGEPLSSGALIRGTTKVPTFRPTSANTIAN
ncbi:MAG: D-alanyl-D-alanine carboxypeptidase family protein [Nitratireductor sp.]